MGGEIVRTITPRLVAATAAIPRPPRRASPLYCMRRVVRPAPSPVPSPMQSNQLNQAQPHAKH